MKFCSKNNRMTFHNTLSWALAGVVDVDEDVEDDDVDDPVVLAVDDCDDGVCAEAFVSMRCATSSAISNCGENVRKTPS